MDCGLKDGMGREGEEPEGRKTGSDYINPGQKWWGNGRRDTDFRSVSYRESEGVDDEIGL